jgi:hypothetical protein
MFIWNELKHLRAENARLKYNVDQLHRNYDFWRASWLQRTFDLNAAHKGIKRLKNKLARLAAKDLLKGKQIDDAKLHDEENGA